MLFSCSRSSSVRLASMASSLISAGSSMMICSASSAPPWFCAAWNFSRYSFRRSPAISIWALSFAFSAPPRLCSSSLIPIMHVTKSFAARVSIFFSARSYCLPGPDPTSCQYSCCGSRIAFSSCLASRSVSTSTISSVCDCRLDFCYMAFARARCATSVAYLSRCSTQCSSAQCRRTVWAAIL